MRDVSPFAVCEVEPSASGRLTLLGLPPVWPGALCAQTDPEAFFPEKGGSTRPAKRICRRCPHTEECLEWALRTGERFGIWGATSPQERRRLRDAGRGSGLDSDDSRKKGAA